jgi:hypothetical protein
MLLRKFLQLLVQFQQTEFFVFEQFIEFEFFEQQFVTFQ